MLLQRGHAAGVSAIAFSADGSRMITGGQDSTVRVWRVADRMLLRVLPYHMVGVTGLALSPDGRLLASGDGAGWLRTWDMVRGRELPAEPPHDRGVDQVAFLPDGAHFVSLDLDGKSWLWSTADAGPRVLPLSAHSQALACSPSPGPVRVRPGRGRRQDHAARAGRGPAEDPGRTRGDGDEPADGDRWPPAGRGRRSRSGRRPGTWRRARRSSGASSRGPIDVLSLSASKELAVAAGRTIHLVPLEPKAERDDPTTRRRACRRTRPRSRTTANGWRPAPRGGASTSGRWATRGPLDPSRSRTPRLRDRPRPSSFSPDGRKIVAGDQDGGIRTWDLPFGVQRPPIPPRRGQVAALSVSGDGRYLLQISQDWQAQVWDLQDGRGLTTIEGSWTSGALTPDGEAIVLTSEADGDLVVVDRADGSPPHEVRAAGGERGRWPCGGTTSARWRCLPTAAWSRPRSVQGPLVCVWDVATGKLVHTIRGHEDPHPITAVQFSPDSPQLLTASEDGSAKLWDLEDGKEAPREAAAFRMVDETSAAPIADHRGAGRPERAAPGRHRRDRRPDPPVGGRASRGRSTWGAWARRSWP